jgi:hypothetical protein
MGTNGFGGGLIQVGTSGPMALAQPHRPTDPSTPLDMTTTL